MITKEAKLKHKIQVLVDEYVETSKYQPIISTDGYLVRVSRGERVRKW